MMECGLVFWVILGAVLGAVAVKIADYYFGRRRR